MSAEAGQSRSPSLVAVATPGNFISPQRLIRSLDGLGSGLDELHHVTGWETIATWLVGISTVVAPMRAANWHSASGGMA